MLNKEPKEKRLMKSERLDKRRSRSPKLEETVSGTNPCILVIFGAGGDLTKRKLIPAIYNLAKAGLLPKNFAVVCVARHNLTDIQFRRNVAAAFNEGAESSTQSPDLVHRLVKRFHYFQSDLLKLGGNHRFKAYLHKIDTENETHENILFYLATPPELFAEIAKSLARLGLTTEDKGWRRIVIEKPFGHDLQSAIELNETLGKTLKESQIYRIDHYLGKETVQNILVFRFANGIFEPIWNRRYIDSVQITVAETLGVESRGGYYEHAGALRDMVSNHLLQLLSLVTMEAPTSFQSDDIRDEKAKVLKAVKTLTPEAVIRQTVRGQYDQGKIDGHPVPAYRTEPKVSEHSNIDTYVAMKLELENWRWAGVPFYLRVGKRLPKRCTEIVVQFKRAPFQLFRETQTGPLPPNVLVMQIQPEEKIELSFAAKIPGSDIRLGNVGMGFDYVDYFGHVPSTGYETLIHDCIRGDGTLFRRTDQVEQSWRVIMPILDVWAALPPTEFPNYAAGSWGPVSADELLKRDGREWHNISEKTPERIKWKKSA
jgi:glucose-6-phosphate 1-dehydrogenase